MTGFQAVVTWYVEQGYASCNHRPVHVEFECDGTPVKTSVTTVVKIGKHQFRRVGRQCSEYWGHREFVLLEFTLVSWRCVHEFASRVVRTQSTRGAFLPYGILNGALHGSVAT